MFRPKMLPNGNLAILVAVKKGAGLETVFADTVQEVAPGSPAYNAWLPVLDKVSAGRRSVMGRRKKK